MINDSLKWVIPPLQPVLEIGDVHVWYVSLDLESTQVQKLCSLLTDDEISRAQRFYLSHDRDHFIVARGLLRILLGGYSKIPPREIRFQYSTRGKPALAQRQPKATLNFNVSHSHGLALLAFAYDRAIGVDLEYIRPDIIREEIAERFFSLQETELLRSLPESLQPTAFFNCWTRKEAFIKATGEGLFRPLDQFSMSLLPGEPARLLHVQGEPQEPLAWFIQNVDVGSSYKAALVVEKPVRHVSYWKYPLP